MNSSIHVTATTVEEAMAVLAALEDKAWHTRGPGLAGSPTHFWGPLLTQYFKTCEDPVYIQLNPERRMVADIQSFLDNPPEAYGAPEFLCDILSYNDNRGGHACCYP